ncbi:hypothetical protein K0T92_14620 [Paenibacillus oenotherae]|uniref:Uncharacterized protein n=1 Tax=Paenibacillus oenotherae TaxID=1435645 RepID=A0ABS7D8X2_9BACL|nr:hypothetical protein [Paenibacillus oenotherae]MBW7475977.1 hypothetical protein [Paenibacillus oenotherae]
MYPLNLPEPILKNERISRRFYNDLSKKILLPKYIKFNKTDTLKAFSLTKVPNVIEIADKSMESVTVSLDEDSMNVEIDGDQENEDELEGKANYTHVSSPVNYIGDLTSKLQSSIEQDTKQIHDSETGDSQKLKDVFWKLMSEGKLAYAYRIAEHFEREIEPFIPARLMHSLVLAQHIRHNSGGLMHALKADYEVLISQIEMGPGLNEETRNLLAAAVLRSAILAPNTNSNQIIVQLSFTGSLYNWMKEVDSFGRSYVPLDLSVLRNIRSESGWQTELKQLQVRTNDAIHRLKSIRITFQPALKVWKKWFEPNGFILSLLQPVLVNDISQIEWLKEQIKKYSDPSETKIKINHADRYEVERSANRHEIIGRTLIQLQTNIMEVIDLAREWVDLVETKPGNNKEYYQRQAKMLQTALKKLHTSVFKELEDDRDLSFPVRVSRLILGKAIQNVYDLFDPEIMIHNKEADPFVILNEDLLMIPEIGLRENYELIDDYIPISILLNAILSPEPTPTQVFNSRLEREDLEGASLILKKIVLDEDLHEELQRKYDKRLKECRESLLHNIRDAVKRVELDFTLNKVVL